MKINIKDDFIEVFGAGLNSLKKPKSVLDAGANGIIAAQINTFEEAVLFADNCRYPSQGRRGANPRVPSNYRSIDDSFFELASKKSS